MPKCCEDAIGDENAIEEFENFGYAQLTDEETLLQHFQNLKKLESCDPLSAAYRVGTAVIIPYNLRRREYA